ncbi:MAG: hypothetical protein PHQ40_01995 [Anaerolineaceae bacterium]|nr:hypothetical protein [Anaerolineaceae bacterium]
MKRGTPGAFDDSVTGDPCIVWDQVHQHYHLYYFAQKHTMDHEINSNALAVSTGYSCFNRWSKLGALIYSNPEALCGDAHKPWILMDPYRVNTAALVDGKFWLFTVSFRGKTKVIQAANSSSLEGPWQVIPKPVVDIGQPGDFDGYHVDAVTAYWFEERGEILIFYMGYPRSPQPDQEHTPYGSNNAAAVMRPGDEMAKKLGKVIKPSSDQNHWTRGYIGGLQIIPAFDGGWYGILNASPTPPAPLEREPSMREPAPSLGGWCYTPEIWPVHGWVIDEQPIEWIQDIPKKGLRAGEGVNLWRHHIVILSDRSMYLLYNSGSYGNERMFGRLIARQDSPVVIKSLPQASL